MIGIEWAVNLLTPTVLFCILNLMIATIFILHSHKKQLPLAGGDQFRRIPSLFGRVRSINISNYRTDPQEDPVNHFTPPEEPVIKHHDQEERVEEHHGEGDEEQQDGITHARRTKSDTKTKKKKPELTILKKSASEKIMIEEVVDVDDRRPATVREKKTTLDGDDEEEVDAKADDFINKFRQQLKLQRLDSILRYKEMLSRGASR